MFVEEMQAAAGERHLPGDRHARRGDDRRDPPVGVRARDSKEPSSSRCSTASGATCSTGCTRRATNVRVYVPFGDSWYPYLMRRLAERPANLLFMAGSV
jgi:hypothetical protein